MEFLTIALGIIGALMIVASLLLFAALIAAGKADDREIPPKVICHHPGVFRGETCPHCAQYVE